MNQIAILPSGCQINHRISILYFDSRYILYTATLAVYVLNAKTFLIEKVFSCYISFNVNNNIFYIFRFYRLIIEQLPLSVYHLMIKIF